MIAFGLGSNITYPTPRAIVVTPPGPADQALMQDYRDQIQKYLRVAEYTSDGEYARRQLARNAVDTVVILPPDPYEAISRGQHAEIQVLYNEIDPTRSWVIPDYASSVESEINRQILMQGAERQRPALQAASQQLDAAIRALDAADAARLGNNRDEALQRVREARQSVAGLRDILDTAGPEAGALSPTLGLIQERLRDDEERLGESEQSLTAQATVQPDTSRMRGRLQSLKETVDRLTPVRAEVLVSPVKVRSQYVAPLRPDVITFFAPAMLALLIQHTAVSLGSLSMVRERLADTFELYMVAPISNFQMLIGKYVANTVFTLAMTGALVGVLVGFFGVPIFGDAWRMGLTLLLLTLTSVGLGFAISLLASSERQAVQFAMLLLLGIVFFSGFALPVDALRQPALSFSYAMPATYGADLLQDVMLRGLPGRELFILVLGALSLVLFLVCLWLLRWRTHAG